MLPSNTLVITLFTPGQDYYIPPPLSRSPTPSMGYASDPESDLRKVKDTTLHTVESLDVATPSRRRIRRGAGDVPDDITKTASWQDLFKYVQSSHSSDTDLVDCLHLG